MKLKKTLALVLATALLLATGACSNKDTSWSIKLGEETQPVGIYILNLINGLQVASMQAGDTENFLTATIEEKTGSQFVVDYAKTESLRQLAIDKKFKEMGLTLTEDEKQQYEAQGKQMYAADQGLYKANGISEQSVIEYNRFSLESYKVFQAIYTGEGEKAATPAEMRTYFADTYNLSYALPYYKVDTTTGAALDEAAIAALNTKVNDDLAKVKAGTLTMVDLIYQVAYVEATTQGEAPERQEDAAYQMVIDKQTTDFPAVLVDHLATATVGEISLLEDEWYKIIVQKLDVATASDDLVTYYYTSMLPTIKQQEYADMVTQWGNELTIEWNDAALSTFNAEKVKKESDGYMAQQNAAQGASSLSLPASSAAPSSESASSESASSESASASK